MKGVCGEVFAAALGASRRSRSLLLLTTELLSLSWWARPCSVVLKGWLVGCCSALDSLEGNLQTYSPPSPISTN